MVKKCDEFKLFPYESVPGRQLEGCKAIIWNPFSRARFKRNGKASHDDSKLDFATNAKL